MIRHVNFNVKITIHAQNIIVVILAHVSKRIASIADSSVTECHEIIIVFG